jgi:hypothetical protein
VYVSIVGVDRVPLRYYRAKLQVERLIEHSGLEWTILRTTQFHDLVLRLCKALARSPVMIVPAATSVQPIDAREVAGPLVKLATTAGAGRVPRHRRATGSQRPGPGGRLPAGQRPSPSGAAGATAGRGLPWLPAGRPPGTGAGRRPGHLRGIPRRAHPRKPPWPHRRGSGNDDANMAMAQGSAGVAHAHPGQLSACGSCCPARSTISTGCGCCRLGIRPYSWSMNGTVLIAEVRVGVHIRGLASGCHVAGSGAGRI